MNLTDLQVGLLLGLFIATVLFLMYRHSLKHFCFRMYYGTENYKLVKSLKYGNYMDFQMAALKATHSKGSKKRIPTSRKIGRVILIHGQRKGYLKTFLDFLESKGIAHDWIRA